jgi:sterol desaturase/sphingolipid hydroxylase (fatty acid hydroxylase superfamily)
MVHLALTGLIAAVVTFLPVIAVYLLLQPLVIAPVASTIASLPTWTQLLVAFLIADFVGYWFHRWSHQHPFLWRIHSVHHSSEALDWIAGARRHPLGEVLGTLLTVVPLVLLGFGSLQVGAVAVFVGIYAVLIPANVRWRWRFLDGKFASPEFHHWHHANEREARDHNFAGALPLWDLLFGTYYMPSDRRPEVYGCDDAVPPGYLAQLAHPFRAPRPGWEGF